MSNSANDQPLAVAPQLTDYVLGWQPGQSPSSRKFTLAQIGATGSLPVTGGSLTGRLVITSGGINVTGPGIIPNLSSGAVSFGTLLHLNPTQSVLAVENPSGEAAQFMSSLAAPGAVAVVIRSDRTDGDAVVFTTVNVVKGSIVNDGTTVHYNTTSDGTLKIDDGLISGPDAIHILMGLKPRWFRWKRSPDDTPTPGFFAQELHRWFPWAVSKGRGRKGRSSWRPWQTDNSKLVPLLTAALQDALHRLDVLEKRA